MAGAAPQELTPYEPLEQADLAAQRGLGQVEPLGRPAEVQLLGDSDEGSQMTHLDGAGRRRNGGVFGLLHLRSMPGGQSDEPCAFCITPMSSWPFTSCRSAASIENRYPAAGGLPATGPQYQIGEHLRRDEP